MIKKCCVCKKIKENGRWNDEQLPLGQLQVSHVYCPSCFRKTMGRINRMALGKVHSARQ